MDSKLANCMLSAQLQEKELPVVMNKKHIV